MESSLFSSILEHYQWLLSLYAAVGIMALTFIGKRVLLLIPAILILPRFLGLRGIYLAGPVSDLGSALLTGFWLWREIRMLGRTAAQAPAEVTAPTAPPVPLKQPAE